MSPYPKLCMMVLLGLAANPAFALPEKAYQNCAALSKTAASEALAMAESWLQEAYSPQAEHCRALSLFALKDYEEAAKALEHVFTQTPPAEMALSVNLLRQAARAWALAGNTERAGQRYARALALLQKQRKASPLTHRLLAETLLENGEFLASQDKPYDALQFMDQAVALNVLGERALVARAALLLSMGQKDMAQADAEAALRLAPQSLEAQQILKEIVSHPATK